MISDIKHILNFRYDPNKYLNQWGNDKLYGDELYIQKTLKEHPEVYDHFKLIIYFNRYHINDNAPSNDVLCSPFTVENLPSIITNYKFNSFGNLVCTGADKHLSKNIKYLHDIKSRFNKIYYEAKDIECDWVQTIPMGMIMAYMLRNGGNDVILPQINAIKNKTKLIASAFGSKFPFLIKKIVDRLALKNFTSNCGFIDDIFCEPNKFYENLLGYKFFACPIGSGIQTPKICECIMCETVPVVTDHVVHRELRDIYGLPLLIVNEWTDLTKQFLNNQWNLVYSKVDWVEQKSKFLGKNFNRFLM